MLIESYNPRPETAAKNRLCEIAETVRTEHAHIETALRESMAQAIHIGGLLTEAKGLVKHGEWGKWIAENCQFSERTAQNYMRVYSRFPEISKTQHVADLTYREAVAMLAEPKQDTEPIPENADRITLLEWCNREWLRLAGTAKFLRREFSRLDEEEVKNPQEAIQLYATYEDLQDTLKDLYDDFNRFADVMVGLNVNVMKNDILPPLPIPISQKVAGWAALEWVLEVTEKRERQMSLFGGGQ
jgi:hypothetical protein